MTLSHFVIYENPSDYPGRFVVRRFVIDGSALKVAVHPAAICDTIEHARFVIPDGFMKMMPHPDDDPVIVETWI